MERDLAYAEQRLPFLPAIDRDLSAFKKRGGFFLAPGMGHCSGGPGPNQCDHLTALEQWVEKGVAPDNLIASHSTNGKVDRTRPLCVDPQVARW